MLCFRPWFVMILLFSAGILYSQPPKESDPQSKIEPKSKPGIGQKFLEKMVGEWEVVKVFYPKKGDPVKTLGSCRQRMIHAGRFLQSDFEFGKGDTQSTGIGTIGYEVETDRFTSFWTDSRSTRISIRQSEIKFDGKKIILMSQSLSPTKETRKSRTETTLPNESTIRHQQFNLTPDGKDYLIMELIMTRREKKSP